MLEGLLFLIACLVAIEWGYAENRLFSDKGFNFDKLILKHFKTYHLFMAVLFGTINALAAAAIFGLISVPGFLLWVWLMIWDTLMLDVTWWLIRFYDFKFRREYALQLYGETNAWHEREDWDNWLGFPLVAGVYWWWWLFAAILTVLGVAVLIL